MFGYPSTQVMGKFRSKSDSRSSGRARFDGFDPPKPKSTRKSDQKCPTMAKRTLDDPEFDVDSKSAISSYSSRLKQRVKPLNSIFRPDPTEPNRYSNSPSNNSDPKNPNLYPGYYSSARTNPNG